MHHIPRRWPARRSPLGWFTVWGTRHARFCGLLAAAALLSACGGSSYTKADFVARANAICTKTLNETRAITQPSSTAQPGGALAAYLGKLVPLLQSEADQIRALKRPPGGAAQDRRTLSQYLAAVGQVVAAYHQLEAAAKRGDAQAIAGVEATLRANPAADLAASYGLRSCGTPGATTA
jgi:hypothetical protein